MLRFRIGAKTVDLAACTVGSGADGGEPGALSPLEARLLRYLAERPGVVVGRDELLTEVWGYRAGVQSRTIDNTVRRLREKIEEQPSEPRFLLSVYGRGVQLRGAVAVGGEVSTPFVGRSDAVDALFAALADDRRLVTVHGPAGVGKTRLVNEVLPRLGAAAIATCAGVATGDELDAAVLNALALVGFDHRADRALASRGALVLVLDEVEHAVDVVRERVDAWRAAAPKLTVIATSRLPLGAPGETVVALGPLDAESASALFLDRVSRVDPTYAATLRTSEAAARIDAAVGALDRLPLALELAAARAPLLGLDGLVGPAGLGAGPMLPILDRSWALLDGATASALSAACAFEAPFDAADLAGLLDSPITDATRSLDTLVRHALIRRWTDGDLVLYAPYAVVRERGRRDGLDPQLVAAHAGWFARLGDPDYLLRARGSAALRRPVWRAGADLRAATDRTIGSDPETAARCALASAWRAAYVGPLRAVTEIVGRFWRVPCSDRVRIHLAVIDAGTNQLNGEVRDLAGTEQAVRIAVAPDDRWLAVMAHGLSLVQADQEPAGKRLLASLGDEPIPSDIVYGKWLQVMSMFTAVGEGIAYAERAIEVASRAGDLLVAGACHAALAEHGWVSGRPWPECLAHAEQALALLSGDDLYLVRRLHAEVTLGRMWRMRGGIDEAEAHLEEALALADRVGPTSYAAFARLEVALVWASRGWYDDARNALNELATRATDVHGRVYPYLLLALGATELQAGANDDARRWLRRAVDESERREATEVLCDALGLLAAAEGDAGLLARAHQAEPGEIALARLHAIAALLAVRADDLADAERALLAGVAAADDLGLRPASDVRQWLDTAAAELDARRATRVALS